MTSETMFQVWLYVGWVSIGSATLLITLGAINGSDALTGCLMIAVVPTLGVLLALLWGVILTVIFFIGWIVTQPWLLPAIARATPPVLLVVLLLWLTPKLQNGANLSPDQG